jgi:hypothetical protein
MAYACFLLSKTIDIRKAFHLQSLVQLLHCLTTINQKMPEGWIDHDLVNQLLTLRSTEGTSSR